MRDALAIAFAGFLCFTWDSLASGGGGSGKVEATRTVSIAYMEAASPTITITIQRTHQVNTMTSSKLVH